MLRKIQTSFESAIINTETFAFCAVAAEKDKRFNMETDKMEESENVFFDVWFAGTEELHQMRLQCENVEEAQRLFNEVKELARDGFISLEVKENGEGLELRSILVHKDDIQYIKTDEDNTTWICYAFGEFEVKNFNPEVIQ